MRIMAIDYGDAHTGIAISDPTGFLTGTTTTIHSRKAEEVAGEIARLVQEHGVEELVMGYPRNMDGTEGPGPELYRDFAALVEDTAGCRPCSGTNGGPPWTPTVSCLRREKTPESEKRRWMRWRPP